MSSAQTFQRGQLPLQTASAYSHLAANSNMHTPSNGLVNMQDIAINMNDRQDHHDASQKQKETKKETPLKRWVRRIFVGKNKEEETREKRNHRTLNHFKKEVRRHLAEYIGTFFLVFIIAGIQINQNLYGTGGVGNIDKGFVAGFVLIGLIYSFGKISGAHFNPCVTLAFALRGAFDFPRVFSYIIVQFAGAVSGAAVLYGLFGNVGGLGTTAPGEGVREIHAFGIEALMTFLLITVVLATSANAQIIGATSGIAVGAMFAAIEVWSWNFTGASVNPWRTIGPTLISNKGWDTYWVYIAGPLVGTIMAVLAQRVFVTGMDREDMEDAGEGSGKHGNKSSSDGDKDGKDN